METYVVRIYQRDEENSVKLVGLVEEAGVKEKKAFHSLDELCSIIINKGKEMKGKKEC